VLTIRQSERDFIHPDGLVPVREHAGARS
jgi:hypothetical protein